MPTLKLTKRAIDTLRPGAKRATYYDSELPGFGLRLEPSGRGAFFIEYRLGGRGSPTKRFTLGSLGTVPAPLARELATKALGRVANGEDPQAARVAIRRQPKALTVEAAVEAFLVAKAHKVGVRTLSEYRRDLGRELVARHGRKALETLTRPDLAELLEKIAARAPISANRCHAALSALLRWAVATGRLAHSPLEGLAKPSRETPRERVLETEELAAILKAAQTTPWPFGPLLRLLALTGQRRQEVGSMRWAELALDGPDPTWTLPGVRAKSRRTHVVPLSPQAVELLASLPRAGDLVFSLATGGFQGWSKAKGLFDVRLAAARDEAGLEPVAPWRLHDLRRSLVTHLARQGFAPHVVDRILNHAGSVIGGVQAVYQRADFLAERRAALNAWGSFLSNISTLSK